jgi:hypothetical protein
LENVLDSVEMFIIVYYGTLYQYWYLSLFGVGILNLRTRGIALLHIIFARCK